MRIRYQSRHGQPIVLLPQILNDAWKLWSNGEERDVPDDAMVATKLRPDTPVRNVRLVDALLTSGPDFVDAASGKNPDFTCAVCGRETLSVGHQDVTPSGQMVAVPYEDADGNRLCEVDFLVHAGEHSAPWRYHQRVERSGALDEARAKIAQQKAAPQTAATPSTRPATPAPSIAAPASKTEEPAQNG